jgi:hypothetical protein
VHLKKDDINVIILKEDEMHGTFVIHTELTNLYKNVGRKI